MDYGDSVVDLDLTNGVASVTDTFAPYNQVLLGNSDQDQGSGGVLLLPAQTVGGHTNLLVQAGKSGTLYLLDRDALGGYNASADQVVQNFRSRWVARDRRPKGVPGALLHIGTAIFIIGRFTTT